MRVLPVLAVAAALIATSSSVPAMAAAPPGVVLLSVNGSGCRPNTTAAGLSADGSAITILYSDYVIPVGSSRPVTRNCQINLKINAAPGYAPTIASVDYRGFASLAAGSTARLSATYGFHGAPHVRSTALRLAGPVDEAWDARDAAATGLMAGTCRGSNVLDLDSTLTLTSARAGAATDFVTMDSTDLVAPSTFRLTWKKCT